MGKAVLISIRPEWVDKILSGEKTLEIRKTKPKLELPFKCYIYMTASRTKDGWDTAVAVPGSDIPVYNGAQTVVAEFVCDYITSTFDPACGLVDVVDCEQSCLSPKEIIRYANGGILHFWHISNLKIYDKPKELRAFCKPVDAENGIQAYYWSEDRAIERATQSWCYVESE